ncbi:MAG: hypothetical protein JEY91_11880 [Spirochaetaceae bacterium]|nr:hypothetical protein [Spirochaetaceae bacterium]
MFVALINFITSIPRLGNKGAFLQQAVIVLIVLSLIVFISGLFNNNVLRTFQVLVVVFTGILSILDDYDSIYGLGLFLISAFMSFKYGFFKDYLKAKVSSIILLTFALVEYSAQVGKSADKWVIGIDAIAYLSLFIFVTYIIYSDEIKAYILKTQSSRERLKKIENQKEILAKKMSLLDAQVQALTAPIDLDSYGITEPEKKTIETLIMYRETEAELAKRLGISFHTVKSHFRHIRDKLGVDRREEIIDMCRNNFRE